MVRFPLILLFIAVTFLSWGVYGPVLHVGQYAMGEPLKPSSLRPFVCVGIAYFLIAVIVPLVLLWKRGEKGHWSPGGIVWSFAAGAAGAIGALGIIFAFKFRGSPVFVMPLVFGLAPVVNTFVTMWMTKTLKQANAIFLAGVIIVAIGAGGVLFFKPSAKHIHVSEADNGQITVKLTEFADGVKTETTFPPATLNQFLNDPDVKEDKQMQKAFALYQKHERTLNLSDARDIPYILIVMAFVALTAVTWGSYGPLLHKGQMNMEGSRLRPFLCVGLAYFAIAVVVPLLAMTAVPDPGSWTIGGSVWSLLAGAAGAIGALGVIMAFNFGGKPIMVMPLVFGGAPVVNTLASVVSEGTASQIGSFFYAFLLLVIIGAVMVLVFSPKPGHAPPKKEKSHKEKTQHEKSADREDDDAIQQDIEPEPVKSEQSDDA